MIDAILTRPIPSGAQRMSHAPPQGARARFALPEEKPAPAPRRSDDARDASTTRRKDEDDDDGERALAYVAAQPLIPDDLSGAGEAAVETDGRAWMALGGDASRPQGRARTPGAGPVVASDDGDALDGEPLEEAVRAEPESVTDADADPARAPRSTHAGRRAQAAARTERATPAETEKTSASPARAQGQAGSDATTPSGAVIPGASALVGQGDASLAVPWALQRPELFGGRSQTTSAEQTLLMGDGAGGPRAASGSGGSVPVAPTQAIADQVADALRGLTRDGSSETRITLDGGPLGRLEALVRLDGADLVVQIRSDDPAVKQALADSLATLVAALEDEGLVMGDVFVDVGGDPHHNDDEPAYATASPADDHDDDRRDAAPKRGLLDTAIHAPRGRRSDATRVDVLA